MEPTQLILLVCILGCGGAAAVLRDVRFAGAGLCLVAVLLLLAARG